jgi:hypothetical protein
MITLISPLAVGNAVQIVVQLPATAIYWLVLRNTTGVFPAYNDPNSTVVNQANAGDPLRFIDSVGDPANGTLYYYQAFYYDGTTWTTDGSPSQATPATTYVDESVDAQSIVRDRLALGLAAEVARGAIALPPDTASIAVLLAPPVFDQIRWPTVSVHLESEGPVNRALGEDIGTDQLDALTGLWDNREGWQARTVLNVVGWSLNPDERIVLRKAIRRVIIANLAVFDANLLLEIEFVQRDTEDTERYNAPVYMTVGTFTSVTPLSVNVPTGVIASVTSTMTPTTNDI